MILVNIFNRWKVRLTDSSHPFISSANIWPIINARICNASTHFIILLWIHLISILIRMVAFVFHVFLAAKKKKKQQRDTILCQYNAHTLTNILNKINYSFRICCEHRIHTLFICMAHIGHFPQFICLCRSKINSKICCTICILCCVGCRSGRGQMTGWNVV